MEESTQVLRCSAFLELPEELIKSVASHASLRLLNRLRCTNRQLGGFLAASPRSYLVFTQGLNRHIVIRDIRWPDKLVGTIAHDKQPIVSIITSPDSRWLLFAGCSSVLSVCDLDAIRQKLRPFHKANPPPSVTFEFSTTKSVPLKSVALPEADERFVCCVTSLHHSMAFVACIDDHLQVRSWHGDLELIQELPTKFSRGCYGVCITQDDNTMVAAGFTGEITIYHRTRPQSAVVDYRPLRTMTADTGFVTAALAVVPEDIRMLHMSPDSLKVIGACNSGRVLIWDAYTARELQRFTQGTLVINHARFAPISNLAFSAGCDSKIVCWKLDAAPGEDPQKWKKDLSGSVESFILTDDEEFLIVGFLGGIVILNPATGKHAFPAYQEIDMGFSSDKFSCESFCCLRW